jgi:hypothetical protein
MPAGQKTAIFFAVFLRLQKELQNPFRLKKIQHIRYGEVEKPAKNYRFKKI